MASLFDILINIAANTASFESGMKKVEDRLTSLGNLVKGGLEFAGITAGLAEMESAISETVAKGDQLTTLAARMGTSVESLSQLQFAASTAGVPIQTLTGAMDVLSRNLVQASEGTGKARQAISDLGIDAGKLAALPLDQQIGIIADKIASLPNPTQQAAAAMRIFGAEGAQLLPILSQGSAGIQKLRDESDALGATMSTESAGQLEEARQAMIRLNAASAGLKDELVADLAPAIAGIETGLTKLLQGAKSVFAAFGQQKIGTSDQDQLGALIKQITAESDQLDKLNQITSARQRIGAQGQVQAAQGQIQMLSAQIAAIEARISAAQKATGDNANDTEQLPEINFSGNDAMYAAWQAKLYAATRTATQQTADQWAAQEEQVRIALAANVIDATQAAAKIQDLNSNYLQPVEVTAKTIGRAGKTVYEGMEKYAESAANSIQSSFATFLTDPSISGFKKMGVAWLETLDKMAADAAASAIFKMIFQGDNTPTTGLSGLLGGLLGGLFGGSGGGSLASIAAGDSVTSATQDAFFGFANGGSFDVGGSGGTDSQLVQFKATPGENVQVGQNGGAPITLISYTTVTSPQVTKNDVVAAMQQTRTSTVAQMKDLKRRGKF